jgi:hypothetical protein
MPHTLPISRSPDKTHKRGHSRGRDSHGSLGKKAFSQRQMSLGKTESVHTIKPPQWPKPSQVLAPKMAGIVAAMHRHEQEHT